MRAVVMWHIGLPFQVLVVAMCFFPQPAGLWDPHGVCFIRYLICLFSSISCTCSSYSSHCHHHHHQLNPLILIPIWFLVFDTIHCLQVLDIMSCHTYHESVCYISACFMFRCQL